jgi:hypothetical protein
MQDLLQKLARKAPTWAGLHHHKYKKRIAS